MRPKMIMEAIMGKQRDQQADEREKEREAADARAEDTPEDAAGQDGDQDASKDVNKDGDRDEEIRELREQLMRVQAEFENAGKRREREAEQLRKFLLESFVKEMLEIKDNLERVLEGLGDDKDGEGLGMVVDQLSRVLAQHGVEEICPQGEIFDPELHEAMSKVDDKLAADTIINVVQKGYRLHERLLRPARVIISSGKTAGEA